MANSNLAFAIPIYALAMKPGKLLQVWPEISQIAFTMYFSYFYHQCDDADGHSPCFRWCIMHFKNLHTFDFLFSHQIISVALCWGMQLPAKTLGTLVWFGINLAYFGYSDDVYTAFLAWIICAVVIVYLYRLSYRTQNDQMMVCMTVHSDIMVATRFLPWVFMAILCKLTGNFVFYDFLHGCWHIFIAIALFKFIV